MEFLFQDPALQNDQLKTRRVSLRVIVTGATAASAKVIDLSGLPGHVAVAASTVSVTGIDASATGITVSDTADATIGVLLYNMAAYDSMGELTALTVETIQSAAATGALTITRKGASAGITTSGNIWFQVQCPGGVLNAATAILKLGITAVYKVQLP